MSLTNTTHLRLPPHLNAVHEGRDAVTTEKMNPLSVSSAALLCVAYKREEQGTTGNNREELGIMGNRIILIVTKPGISMN